MGEKINIAAILKDKKNGIRLYSPIFGDCTFCCVREDTNDICVKKDNGVKEFFDSKGLYYNTGEVMLFPSKEMRDWNKLYWKKGDVLVNEDGDAHVIFKWFDDDTYKTFNGNYYLENNVGIVSFVEHEGNFLTSDFYKENKENAHEYIRKIEEKLGVKLNSDNLEIEKTQPEFKDGDVLFVKCYDSAFIEIFKYSKNNGDLYDRASLDTTNQILDISGRYRIGKDEITEIRLATEAEKQQLFSALKKEGKAWDSEKKQIVDLNTKVDELKPFDKVLVRDGKDEIWEPSFFFRYLSQFSGYNYQTVGGEWRVYCIPYIGNESLLCTTKDVEG